MAVDARWPGLSISETAHLLEFLHSTISGVLPKGAKKKQKKTRNTDSVTVGSVDSNNLLLGGQRKNDQIAFSFTSIVSRKAFQYAQNKPNH